MIRMEKRHAVSQRHDNYLNYKAISTNNLRLLRFGWKVKWKTVVLTLSAFPEGKKEQPQNKRDNPSSQRETARPKNAGRGTRCVGGEGFADAAEPRGQAPL